MAAECPVRHRPGWNLLRFRDGVRQEPSGSLGFARNDSLCCHVERRGMAPKSKHLNFPEHLPLRFAKSSRSYDRRDPSTPLRCTRDDSPCCHLERRAKPAVERSRLTETFAITIRKGSDKAEKMSNRNRSRLLIHHCLLGHRSCSRSCLQLAPGFRWSNRKPSMPQPRAASTLAGRSSMKSVSPGCRP